MVVTDDIGAAVAVYYLTIFKDDCGLLDFLQTHIIIIILNHRYSYMCMYIYILIWGTDTLFWVNYNDLTVLPHWNHG